MPSHLSLKVCNVHARANEASEPWGKSSEPARKTNLTHHMYDSKIFFPLRRVNPILLY